MRKKLKSKKKGFTLIELIAVLAIIALLMVVFVPKVSGYIGKAKKVKALEQVRQVVLAVDSYNIESASPIDKGANYKSFKGKINSYAKKEDLANVNNIKSIPDEMTYTQMKEILQDGKEFTLNNEGEISIITTTTNNTETNN